ncbi:MAG: CarD family transcriptional regulator [Clostridia bacterium]|nr:CarD family transcriptional regulator [Clostridia bacterium]
MNNLRFSVGETIVYGSTGVCEIVDICHAPFDTLDINRLYYVLKPIRNNDSSMVYSPVDNLKVNMRHLMSVTQAKILLESIAYISPLIIDAEKGRKESYKAALASCSPEAYVSVIKEIYRRRIEYKKNGRRFSETDGDYERMAKNCLYCELSVVLNVTYGEIEETVAEALERVFLPER